MNKKQILPSWQIDSNESKPKSPPSKRRRLTYEEKGIFLCLTNELQITIQCVVVDILESNLRCLLNYKCIHECTLNNLRMIF